MLLSINNYGLNYEKVENIPLNSYNEYLTKNSKRTNNFIFNSKHPGSNHISINDRYNGGSIVQWFLYKHYYIKPYFDTFPNAR